MTIFLVAGTIICFLVFLVIVVNVHRLERASLQKEIQIEALKVSQLSLINATKVLDKRSVQTDEDLIQLQQDFSSFMSAVETLVFNKELDEESPMDLLDKPDKEKLN